MCNKASVTWKIVNQSKILLWGKIYEKKSSKKIVEKT